MPTNQQIKTGIRRLRKLADWLEKNVPEENFNLEIVLDSKLQRLTAREIKYRLSHHTCGSTACAIGYTPLVFPKLVKYGRYRDYYSDLLPVYKNTGSYIEIAVKLFYIRLETVYHLFSPNGIHGQFGKDESLAGTVTRIRDFCNRQESELCQSAQ